MQPFFMPVINRHINTYTDKNKHLKIVSHNENMINSYH